MKKNDVYDIAAKMSDAELFSFFSGEKFYSNPELTIAVCQEIENREAALTNREPAVVAFGKMEDDTNGVSCGGCIILNENSLKKNIKHSPAEVLNTLLHEGRHEWQTWMIYEHPECLPEHIRQMITVDRACYTSCGSGDNAIDVGIKDKKIQSWIEYSMQEIEMDARFYAIYRMKQIAGQYNQDEDFQEAIDKAIDIEVLNLSILLENMDEEQYLLLEKLQLEKYMEVTANMTDRPELPKDFRCYGNIWMIRNVVYPAFGFLISLSQESQELNAGKLLYDLYEEARLNLMGGTPLESPEQLIRIVLSDNDFKSEYLIRDQDISKGLDLKKPIAM